MTCQQIDEQILQAKEISSTNPDKCILLLEEAISTAVDTAYFSKSVADIGITQLFSGYYASGINGLQLVHRFCDLQLAKQNISCNALLHAHLLYLKAKAYRYNMEVTEALGLTQQAMLLCEKETYSGAGYSEMLEGMAYNLIILERYEEAYATLTKTESLAKQNNNFQSLARAVYYTAVLNSRLGNMHDCIMLLIKTVRLAITHGLSESFLQSCYCDIAVTLNLLGKNSAAVSFFSKAEEIGRKMPVSLNFLNVLLRKSIALETVGRLNEVEALLNEYQTDFEACQNANVKNQYYYFRLLIHLNNRELADCKPYVEQLERNYAGSPEAFIRSNILGGLADYYSATGDYRKANIHLRKIVDDSIKFYNDERSSRIRSMQIQQNITQAKREKEQAEKIAKARQEFLAGMSHEIRSPMNAIIALSGLLAEEAMPEEQKRKVNIIKRSSENLLAVVNDILDNAKIESGRFALESTGFNLNVLLNEVVELAKVKADAKGVAVNLYTSNQVPEHVTGDPVRLRQIVINLLNNAVKFTHEGQVSITLTELPDNHVSFKVEDTGIGIQPSQIQNIFKGYTQASANTTRLFGGTGLGLKISNELVQLMGGRLTVESEYGKGSCFSFAIPLPPFRQNISVPETEAYAYRNSKTYRFLVADDLADNRFAYRQILNSVFPNSEVLEAENGEEVLSITSGNSFNLVLMDIDMPVMNGIEACIKLRGRDKNVAILGASANVMMTVADLKNFGFTDFIMKPFTKEQLVIKLIPLLNT